MPPRISAHRGGSEVFPAETYEAFALAADSGAEYVECDVRRLGDGSLVCRHDAVADAQTLTYRELCRRLGYEVPLLGKVLAQAGAVCHIDLKETGYEPEVAALARRIVGPDGFVVSSMVDASLRRVGPEVTSALSIGRGPGDVPAWGLPAAIVGDLFPARRVRRCGAAAVAVNRRLAPWVLGRCVREGIATMVWTVDRLDELDRLLADPRVDVLVTNRPLLALERRRMLHCGGADRR